MARKPRIHAPGALYHVILRGNAGADIFLSDVDCRHFEWLVAEGVKRFEHRIHAYCWMINHIHLAIQVGLIPLSKIIQNLAFRYARWMNKREARSGHLFQGRYRALLVDDDRYLLTLVRYIHLNPVRARLVERPEEYPWSGHRGYLGGKKPDWLTTDLVLSCFGAREAVSRRRYRTFVEEGIGEAPDEALVRGNHDGRLLGDDHFVERLVKEGARDTPVSPSLDAISALVCQELGMKEAALMGPSSARRLAQARQVVAHLTLACGSGTLAEVSRRYHRDPGALGRGVERLRGRLEQDNGLREKIEGWKAALLKRQIRHA